MIVRKSSAELEKMRRSGLLVWQVLQELAVLLGATVLEDRPPRTGLHPRAEAVLALAPPGVGLEGSLRHQIRSSGLEPRRGGRENHGGSSGAAAV